GYVLLRLNRRLQTESTAPGGLIVIRFFQGIASAALMPVIQAYVGDITLGRAGGYDPGMLQPGAVPRPGFRAADGRRHPRRLGASGRLRKPWGSWRFVGRPDGPDPSATHRQLSGSPERPSRSVAWKRLLLDREIIGLFMFRFGYTLRNRQHMGVPADSGRRRDTPLPARRPVPSS
ncbi:MAG: hypothetical protein MZV70_41975, partial [Desulfobacterales bacterium]|nr:hypothetical protein [Desulfobacterales bacterium]